MKTRTVLLCVLAVLAGLSPLLAGDAYVKQADQKIVIGNDSLELVLDLSGDRARLASIANKLGPSTPLTDEGFLLQVNESQEIAPSECRIGDKKVEDTENGGKRVTVLLKSESTGIEVRLVYELGKNDFFVRKRFAVRNTAPEKDLAIYRAQIERLATGAECELGGMGQPIFIGKSVFIGLEYPAAWNQVKDGQICLFHYPGKKLGKEFLDLKTEVIGVAGKRPIEEAFAEYLRKIRIPPRSFILYNSWYDIRRAKMSNEVFIECFKGFQNDLIDRYGVTLDSFVIDDGYQDKDSIWKTDRSILPDDFNKLADYLKANGSCFGIWMPLTPCKGNLNLDWGREHGYEVTDTGDNYCISGPKFNHALREIIAHHIKTFGLNYYKHDFNSFRCAAPGHSHLPKPEYGFESNVDAYIEVLKYARRLNPHIFLNVTGGMWLSPWWLEYADTVWRGGGDTGREGGVPYVEQRDDTMTYVDGVLWDRFVKERTQFPPSALMTHGIVYAQLCMLGGKDEPAHRWAEHVIAYLAPGLMMIELYLTPSIVSEEQWAVLGPALAWARENKDVMVETKMTHGNPHLGKACGFKHVNNGRLIWFVRNPSMVAQQMDLPVADALGAKPADVSIVYPYRMSVAQGDTLRLTVPPYQTMVVEASVDHDPEEIAVKGCRSAIVAEEGGKATIDLIAKPGETISVQVASPIPIREASLDGATLQGVAGKEASFEVEFPGGDQQCTLEEVSGDKAGNTSRVHILVPESVSEAKLGILCEKVMKVVPMGKFLLNGENIKPKIVYGDGWRFFLVPLVKGQNEVTCEIPLAKRAMLPFSPSEMTVSAWLFTRRELPRRRLVLALDGELPAKKRLPTPFAHIDPACRAVQERRVVRTIAPGESSRITKDDFAKIKSAKLHVNVFDVNGDENYGNKPVLLNGAAIGILPANHRPINRWEEQTMDVPKEQLSLLKPENAIVFTNPTADAFKVGDIGLAVQLADGTWVESNRDASVHCSSGGWKYTEGKAFKNGQSEAVRLALPVE